MAKKIFLIVTCYLASAISLFMSGSNIISATPICPTCNTCDGGNSLPVNYGGSHNGNGNGNGNNGYFNGNGNGNNNNRYFNGNVNGNDNRGSHNGKWNGNDNHGSVNDNSNGNDKDRVIYHSTPHRVKPNPNPNDPYGTDSGFGSTSGIGSGSTSGNIISGSTSSSHYTSNTSASSDETRVSVDSHGFKYYYVSKKESNSASQTYSSKQTYYQTLVSNHCKDDIRYILVENQDGTHDECNCS
jgi:hypothetical protein